MEKEIIEFSNEPTPSIEFKKGDRVWHIGHGWGEIAFIDGEIGVIFENGCSFGFPLDTKELFFKEQQLDYSRPPWQPKEGEWCWFWDDFVKLQATVAKFIYFDGKKFAAELTGKTYSYDCCAPFIGELPPHLKEAEK